MNHPFAFAIRLLRCFAVGCFCALAAGTTIAKQPNIVLVIADDQGYGDLACHGNPVIQTPHLDQLASESSTLSDYHVAPTCSPTRAALITGHWTNRTGVWHTINGRSMLRRDETTLATMLQDAGYITGMFGKWHLGDNYPYRPEDRGFETVFRHGGGGVGQTPDAWDNAYFGGHYFHNGELEAAEGFCTDVFFDQADRFIESHAKEDRPFFAYISTNAPHGPLHCPEHYLAMYSKQPSRLAAFYGMITNIDDRVGSTRALLQRLGIKDQTIFIFTTDNGTATGARLFNAGMRGQKGSEFDGGHRVPFMLHWPNGGMATSHADDTLCHAVDVVPTLLDLCDVAPPSDVEFDGVSIKSLLMLDRQVEIDVDRMLITDSQRVRDPVKWRKSSVMSGKWRLINGEQLYHVGHDPGQQNDVAEQNSDRVARMRAFYESWWQELEPTFSKTTEIVLGHPEHQSVLLTAHDWIQDTMPPWNQAHIRKAETAKQRRTAPRSHDGHWAIVAHRTGNYRFTLRRYPAESNMAINAEMPPGKNVPGADAAFRTTPGRAIEASTAVLRIDGRVVGQREVTADATSIEMDAALTQGSHELSPIFKCSDGDLGVFYCTVEWLPESTIQ
ncbi:MAG: arylsulfatase [Planctomycetota bacterium]